MDKYTCPRCLYSTNQKGHMRRHLNRSTPCQMHQIGVFLTDTIKEDVLQCNYIHAKQEQIPEIVHEKTNKETKNETTIFNTTYTVIQQCNILTNQDLVSLIYPHIKSLKYGQSKIFDRLNPFQQQVEDEKHIDHKDVLTMTNDITQTRDDQTLTDAYYGFNKVNLNYVKRIDGIEGKHHWTWQPCLYSDILSEIVEQLKEYVFVAYEVKLNNNFKENGDSMQLINFYKINKYLYIKPLCCTARHDNQVLFFNTDEEYDDNPGTIELCDELNALFDNTNVDLWEMKDFLEKIEHLIQSNAGTTYDMIIKLVCNVGNITVPCQIAL
jgi:hypothetical protein